MRVLRLGLSRPWSSIYPGLFHAGTVLIQSRALRRLSGYISDLFSVVVEASVELAPLPLMAASIATALSDRKTIILTHLTCFFFCLIYISQLSPDHTWVRVTMFLVIIQCCMDRNDRKEQLRMSLFPVAKPVGLLT